MTSKQQYQTVNFTKEKSKQLFARLASIFGHKFTSQYPTAKAIATAENEWAQGVGMLSDFQINHALTRCHNRPGWNPSIPEFKRLACNLPEIETVINRVLNKKIIDPLTQYISIMIGGYDLSHKSAKQLEKTVRGIYLDSCEEVINKLQGKTSHWATPQQLENKTEKETEKPKDFEGQKDLMDEFYKNYPEMKKPEDEELVYNESELLSEKNPE